MKLATLDEFTLELFKAEVKPDSLLLEEAKAYATQIQECMELKTGKLDIVEHSGSLEKHSIEYYDNLVIGFMDTLYRGILKEEDILKAMYQILLYSFSQYLRNKMNFYKENHLCFTGSYTTDAWHMHFFSVHMSMCSIPKRFTDRDLNWHMEDVDKESPLYLHVMHNFQILRKKGYGTKRTITNTNKRKSKS